MFDNMLTPAQKLVPATVVLGTYGYEYFEDGELGGDDQIWGGDDGVMGQLIVGGPYNDKIWTGSGVTGGANKTAPNVNAYDLLVYGDKNDWVSTLSNFTPDEGVVGESALVEYPDTFNKFDGDDIIDVGNDNMKVYVYGQGGNDKIIGGHGTNQVEKLFGGSGDDKIWLVNPEERALDTTAG